MTAVWCTEHIFAFFSAGHECVFSKLSVHEGVILAVTNNDVWDSLN